MCYSISTNFGEYMRAMDKSESHDRTQSLRGEAKCVLVSGMLYDMLRRHSMRL